MLDWCTWETGKIEVLKKLTDKKGRRTILKMQTQIMKKNKSKTAEEL
jgi:hypothetical protein